jgi:hypothetical protein
MPAFGKRLCPQRFVLESSRASFQSASEAWSDTTTRAGTMIPTVFCQHRRVSLSAASVPWIVSVMHKTACRHEALPIRPHGCRHSGELRGPRDPVPRGLTSWWLAKRRKNAAGIADVFTTDAI